MTELKQVSEYKTANGRNCSHFTLFCKFHKSAKYDNPKFTYRGDRVIRQMHLTKNKKFASQIDALTFQAELVQTNIREAVLFDNSFEHPFNIVKRWINGEIVEDYSSQYTMHKTEGLLRSIPIVPPTEKTTLKIETPTTHGEPIQKKEKTQRPIPARRRYDDCGNTGHGAHKNETTASVSATVKNLVDTFKIG